jgi:predicted anti-sigma-YlaC factor YlaD
MDHESAKAGFTCYHDELLSEDESRMLEEHLAECLECRTEWESFKETLNKLSGLSVAGPSEGFVENVSLEIRRRGIRGGWSRQHFLILKTAFLSFILILFLILLYLSYVFLFSDGKQTIGASHKDRDGLHIIGPVDTKISTPPNKKK